jgi:hypothetical protein
MNQTYRASVAIAAASAFIAVGGASLPLAAVAQSKADAPIVGVWKLVSAHNTGKDGVKKMGSYGPNPQGLLIFTANGYYTSVNSRPDIPKFASGSRMTGTPEENKAVVQGSIGSFGTYTVDASGKQLTYKVQGGTWPGWTGTDQKRQIALVGDDLTLTLTASYGGTSDLVYKRVK